ncbi:tripartite motif-containing protein 35 [Sarotherodon galilaeus]
MSPWEEKEEMAKGKSKIKSSEGLAPPQARSLRSRKRECPSDDISLTDDVQAPHQQDAEEYNTALVSTSPHCPQSPAQECAKTTNQQEADQACATKQEKDAGCFTNVELKEQDANNPQNDSQLGVIQVLSENFTNKSGTNEEENDLDECNRSPYDTRTDQLQVFSPITKEDVQSCPVALNGQENSDVESNQHTGPEEPINVCLGDVPKRSAAGLPAKKKRRMGMCGLTEKERSHFLMTQKRENWQNREDKVEKPICENTAEPVTLEENTSSLPLPSSPPSIPADGQNVGPREEEIKLQPSHCKGDERTHRAESEACAAVSPSDGSTAGFDSGCSEGKGCEHEDGIVTDSEQAGDLDHLAEKEAGEDLGSQKLQQLKVCTNEIMAKVPKNQEEAGSAEANCSSAMSFCTSQDEKSDGQAPLLQVDSVTGTRDEKEEGMNGNVFSGDGADKDASCSHTLMGGLNCGSVELCETAATPSVSERKDSRDPDEPAAGPSAVHADRLQTLSLTADSFGSGCLDYVSDSQLNTIVLIEDEMMQKEEDPDSSDCDEDGTDLICGLIRELSSLNRRVMAAHRELESLRRSSKGSRNLAR